MGTFGVKRVLDERFCPSTGLLSQIPQLLKTTVKAAEKPLKIETKLNKRYLCPALINN